MLARAESEPIFSHHDHALFLTEVAGPHVLKSLDRTVRINDEDLIRHPYPTWIIQTESADFYLEHFSAFEPGFEESPNQLIKKVKDDDGNYLSEEVLLQFVRRNSTKTGQSEYHLVSGHDLSGLILPEDVENPSPGFLGRMWVKNDKQVWRYFAGILTGHEDYGMPKKSIDPSVQTFLTRELFPEPPIGASKPVLELSIFVNQAA